jgi:hypothetical protein
LERPNGKSSFQAKRYFETNPYDSKEVMVLYFIMALPFAGSRNKTPAP